MASSSVSTIMASPESNSSNFDVYLSFRGEDTRYSFTDHLYSALKQAGIHAFRDSDEIDRGEELKPEIEKAIKASKTSIIVLSENYATSTWCLDELWLILEQRSDNNHFVLPVFYHVNPADVRNQNKSFHIEVKTSPRWTYDNVNRWKTALRKVADLTGLILSGHEVEFLKDIVDTVYNKLDRKQIYIPPNLIGMDARVQEINSWLIQPHANFLAICGMGGSGKSTLAQYIVYSNWQNFENIGIVECIGSRCKERHDLLKVQEELLKDILGGKNRRIPSVCQGTYKIEEVLQTKKALIVLDDIVESSQLVTLLGTGNINKASKIIVTTRDHNIGAWFKSKSTRYHKYKMKLLDDGESLELLSLHAFGSKIPKIHYKEIAKKVVQYCEGLPLALEVWGSSMSENNSFSSWRSALNLLEKDIPRNIYTVLKRSYDLLPFDSDRELFLHIACFFAGMDKDYVVTVLEPDYSAEYRIKTLTKRCLLYVTPNNKLMMHRLLQDMGRNIVKQESHVITKRSRVWRDEDSYDMLRNGKSSQTMKGLALDMHMLMEKDGFNNELKRKYIKESHFSPLSLQEMDQLELLKINFVRFKQFTKDFSKNLRWLCWVGFKESTMPAHLCMGNMVALDMSYSCLEEFEPPMVLQSLKILNLKSSRYLNRIHNISRLPNLETLILWNCNRLHSICKTIKDLTSLSLLNMTGCDNLQSSILLPCSLVRLFLKDCNFDHYNDSTLSFSDHSFLQYLNLGNSMLKVLPAYNHLKSLRVLDLSLSSRLKSLHLPSTLAELYIYYCTSLERVTFESHQFTLQEFGYEGCINLSEIEGFIKLVEIAKSDEADLGHMKWLKGYQDHELCLAGDDELMSGRSCQLQILYEFNIMSTSLPDIKNPNMPAEYISESSSLSFDVPLFPKNRMLKGLNVTFRYTISGEDLAWFAKISTTNGVDLIYSPKVFGKPAVGEIAIWLSYWPIGNKLHVGDKINVSIIVMNGLEICKCGASFVYADDEVTTETLENNIEWAEILGGDYSGFQLSTGAYYLCRRDFFELMEVDTLTSGWLSILVGDHTIHDTEVRGWRKTGRPQQSYQSFTELKTIRCIVYGPQSEEIYKITSRVSKALHDKSVEFSIKIDEAIKFATTLSNDAQKEAMDMSEASVIKETMEFTSTSSLQEKMEYATPEVRKMRTKGLLDQPLVASPSSRREPSPWEVRRSYDINVNLSLKKIDNDYFQDYLCDALDRAAFMIKRGKPSQAKVSIIVLSKGYVSSSWHLIELLKILDERRNSRHFVLPVFYHLEPSYIIEHGERLLLQTVRGSVKSMQNLDMWNAALMEVANISGISFSRWSRNDDDTAGITEIVSIVYHALSPA